MKKKIIIFGGTGFIGHNLIKRLKKEKFIITSIARGKIKKNKKIKGVKYINCDISKTNQVKKLDNSYHDYLINLSGNIDHKNKIQTTKTHFYGTKNILDHFLKSNFKLFVQIGSSLEYANRTSPHKEENTRNNPQSFYGRAKLKASNYLQKCFKKKYFPYIILRLYQVYGPYQKLDRLIPYVISNALKGKSFRCSSGTQYRDFIYVDDLVELIIKVLKKKKFTFGIFNVGLGKPIKVRDIINLIIKLIGKGKPMFGRVKMRKEESDKFYPNTLKIYKNFNWKPKISILKGLKKTIAYYEKF